VTAASRQVYDAQVQSNETQQNFGNLLILGVIAALAAVTLINTLAVATFEHRSDRTAGGGDLRLARPIRDGHRHRRGRTCS
jgi:hypothetical protein